ncbi:hypothetical protein N7537_008724 [Penicillium hordei]|uniref:Uncharacterized protein n=1 Tax=Penicillium hordei TaxID=40994 RepID=A0AAD6GYP7_9EURO|nr:uncharacterized protein N7537_008724 [Penicillium hordei]KAJ5598640.1 hypothetical protein N7537_008724 [Penicillium hordei]
MSNPNHVGSNEARAIGSPASQEHLPLLKLGLEVGISRKGCPLDIGCMSPLVSAASVCTNS